MALEYVDGLGPGLDRYHLFHAVRADHLRTLGRSAEAADADCHALELTGKHCRAPAPAVTSRVLVGLGATPRAGAAS